MQKGSRTLEASDSGTGVHVRQRGLCRSMLFRQKVTGLTTLLDSSSSFPGPWQFIRDGEMPVVRPQARAVRETKGTLSHGSQRAGVISGHLHLYPQGAPWGPREVTLATRVGRGGRIQSVCGCAYACLCA